MKYLFDIDGIAYEVELSQGETKQMEYKKGRFAKVTLLQISKPPTETNIGSAFLRVEFDNGNVWSSKDAVIPRIKTMALDKNCKATPYLTGRVIAVVERYAGDKFGPGTLTTMISHPQHSVSVFLRYVDKDDAYYKELQNSELPATMTPLEQGQVWVGYYHQKEAYDREETRGRLGKRVAEIRKSIGMTQEELAEKAGLQRTHIVRIEQGRYNVGVDTLQAIADVLGYDVELITKKP